jgi:putative glutamine amidotransferase
MRPLIGVTTSELRSHSAGTLRRHGEPPHPEMALGMTYLRAIDAAGGVPVVLPPLGDAEAFLDRLDGICLSGGPDLDPDAYGAAERHVELGPTEPSLDAFELALARAADARGLPILGVCRGAQALNVARGGTLHQHVPDLAGVSLEHRQTAPGERPAQAVEIEAGSLLARTLGRRVARVNSFHHQAVRRLGRGLRVVARAPDGVVEGIEGIDGRFVLGVQWHAECLIERATQLRLFRGFVAAARTETAPALRVA